MMFLCGVDPLGNTEQIQSDDLSGLCASRVYKKA